MPECNKLFNTGKNKHFFDVLNKVNEVTMKTDNTRHDARKFSTFETSNGSLITRVEDIPLQEPDALKGHLK